MISALLARALTTFTSALFGVLTARMILGESSVEYYTAYALITTLPALILFSDLGSGAVLVNTIAASSDPDRDPQVEVTITAVGRVMLGFATVVMAISVIGYFTGLFELLLGDTGRLPNAGLAAFLCLATFALTVPLGIWPRVLLGLQRNHLTVLIQGLAPPANFGFVWAILNLGSGAHIMLAMSFYLSAFVVALIGTLIAGRLLPTALLRGARRIPWPRRFPGVRVMDVGWPMLAQMLSAPLSLTSQRFVLAQFAPTAVVAEYTAAAQVFLSFMGMINAAGLALWPQFAKQRAAGTLQGGPGRFSVVFGAAAALVMTGICLVSGPLFAFTTNDQITVGPAALVGFSAMVVFQAVLYPLGMFIMDKPGIRFQMIPTLTMALGSLGLAVVLTPALGLIGPIVGNCAAVLLAQIIPFSLYIRRHRDRLMGVAVS